MDQYKFCPHCGKLLVKRMCYECCLMFEDGNELNFVSASEEILPDEEE